MIEIETIDFLLALIREQFLVVALFLTALGAVLKYQTDISNELIAVIVTVASFFLCASLGWFTSGLVGAQRVFDAMVVCGLVHGGLIASGTVYGWDVLHGLYKFGVLRKKQKQGVTKP